MISDIGNTRPCAMENICKWLSAFSQDQLEVEDMIDDHTMQQLDRNADTSSHNNTTNTNNTQSGTPSISKNQQIKTRNRNQTKDNDQKDKFFTIDKVIGKRKMKNGAFHYLIKWKNYSDKFNSFEPIDNLNKSARRYIENKNVPIV